MSHERLRLNGHLELVPVVIVSGRRSQYADIQFGLWALPGGGSMTTAELARLALRQGWDVQLPGDMLPRHSRKAPEWSISSPIARLADMRPPR